jgi:hypothetical protein
LEQAKIVLWFRALVCGLLALDVWLASGLLRCGLRGHSVVILHVRGGGRAMADETPNLLCDV